MKNSIVLFISLLFISALSFLLVQNLDDTNTYIKEQNKKLNKIQMLSLFSNAKDEAKKVINKYGSDLTEEPRFPLVIKDITMSFCLSKFEKLDINLIARLPNNKDLENLFVDKDINDFYLFKEIYMNKRKEFFDNDWIKNNKQVEDIINAYIEQSYSRNKHNIKDEISFINIANNANNSNNSGALYELNLSIDYLNNTSKANYILDANGGVKNFEISFK